MSPIIKKFKVLIFVPVFCLFFLAGLAPASAQTEEVKENQIVILKMPTGPAKVIKARQVQVKELVIMTMDSEGRRTPWQRTLVAKMVSLHDETTEKLTKPQIEEILTEYNAVVAEFPDSKELLGAEIIKWKNILDSGEKMAAEQTASQAQALQTVTEPVFDDSKNYSREELAAVIDPAQKAVLQYPVLGGKIEEYLKPWQQRMEYLKEGRKLFEGQWLTGQEIRKIQEERVSVEQEKHFKEKAKLTFSRLVLPQTSVLITILIAVGTLLSVLFSFFHLATARGGNLTFGGALTLLLGLGILGAYGYYAYNMLNFTTDLNEYWADAFKIEGPEEKMPNPLPRMLFMASGSTIRNISPEDGKVELQDTQINLLAKKYLKLERKTPTEILDMERIQLVVRFHSDRIEFIDEADCLGKRLLIRYYVFYKSEANSFSIYDQQVYIGGAKLPSSLASFLFRQFLGNLQECLAETNITAIYSIEKIEAGKLSLVWPMAASTAPAKARQPEPDKTLPAGAAPAAVPAPAATPVPAAAPEAGASP